MRQGKGCLVNLKEKTYKNIYIVIIKYWKKNQKLNR